MEDILAELFRHLVFISEESAGVRAAFEIVLAAARTYAAPSTLEQLEQMTVMTIFAGNRKRPWGQKHRAAFTLIEIMIVVGIIGLLMAVAIPNITKARKSAQRTACIANLKAIEGAKGYWALEMKKGDADVPTDADIFGPDKAIAQKPACPSNGTYDIKAVSEKPTCTVPDHAL